MSKWSTLLHCGALVGLAMLFFAPAAADEELRQQVHREFRHQSYMLVEGADGARLYLFATADQPSSVRELPGPKAGFVQDALRKVRSNETSTRVRGLTELAGVDDPEALDAALTLLTDPNEAVRNEAVFLILDHPQGAATALALGLVDDDEEEE